MIIYRKVYNIDNLTYYSIWEYNTKTKVERCLRYFDGHWYNDPNPWRKYELPDTNQKEVRISKSDLFLEKL